MKVVLFLPETGIYPFLRSLTVIGRALKSQGHEVYLTKCTGQMARCSAFVMNQTHPLDDVHRHKYLCKVCQKKFSTCQKENGFFEIDLSKYISTEEIEEIELLVKGGIKSCIAQKYRGFPVGTAAQYDLALETKASFSEPLAEANKDLYVKYIVNTAIACAISTHIVEDIQPDVFLTINQYAQCEAVKFAATQRGTHRVMVTHPLHCGMNFERFILSKENWDFWFCNHRLKWGDVKHLPLTSNIVRECWRDVMYRSFKPDIFVYSPMRHNDPGDLFERLGIPREKKIIVAYMSCAEERSSLESSVELWGDRLDIQDVFPSQLEWIEALAKWVRPRNDIVLVVRMHPREGVNKRDQLLSQNYFAMKERFSTGLEHCVLIWPEDKISSYDLAEIASVASISWSGMGMELIRTAVPVVCSTSNFHYVEDECIRVPKTVDDYFQVLEECLSLEYHGTMLQKALRYYYWRVLVPSLKVDGLDFAREKYERYDYDTTPDLAKIFSGIMTGVLTVDQYNIRQWQESRSLFDDQHEWETIRVCVKSYIFHLYFGASKRSELEEKEGVWQLLWRTVSSVFSSVKDKGEKQDVHFLKGEYVLHYVKSFDSFATYESLSVVDRSVAYFLVDGLDTCFICGGKAVKRTSKSLQRLAWVVKDK
jgi:hypothetical protein